MPYNLRRRKLMAPLFYELPPDILYIIALQASCRAKYRSHRYPTRARKKAKLLLLHNENHAAVQQTTKD